MIALLGYVSQLAMTRLERWLIRWKPAAKAESRS
jgi:ABC-type nitrate/sulfonate/bicarbonate transport system permease component